MKPDKVAYKGENYYIIPASFLKISIILLLIMSICTVYVRNILNEMQEKQKISYNTYENIESRLINKKNCYICGDNQLSIKNTCRKMDTLGIISLDDWDVIDIGLKMYDEQGVATENYSCRNLYAGNAGEINYVVNCIPSKEESSVEISIPEDYRLDLSEIEKNLCQSCLDKVGQTLEVRKLDTDDLLYPLCLIDFKTLEIYALQQWNTQYRIRDYKVEIDYSDRSIILNASIVK